MASRAPMLCRHSSRAAMADRYATISNFFRRTEIRLLPPAPPAPRFNYSLTLVHKTGYSPTLTRLTQRSSFFHSSALQRNEQDNGARRTQKLDEQEVSQKTKADEPPKPNRSLENQNYSGLYRRLALSFPPMHTPTREDFLNVASNFWERFRIRFKWFTVRSFRRFNADDISAFVTWFLMSQTVWILVGTTTFFSVVFAIVNSLRMQESVARAISSYLTSETGVSIIFESAIVPKWKDSRISFKNVYISRRPAALKAKPSADNVEAGHRAAARYDIGNHPAFHGLGVGEEEEEDLNLDIGEDTNYSMFDVSLDSIDVTLSLWRWLDGKGLIQDAVVKGVRGVFDRRFVRYDPDKPLDPAAFRSIAKPGDFELESLQIEDLLVTVHQPGAFRPYTASIFRADIRTFRKQWMFHDFLSAENVVGQFDNCLFSLHKPQSIGRTNEQDLQDGQWSRMSRFRIDGVNIDHIQAMTSEEGPISWITSGKVDAVLDIKFPRPPDDQPINVLLEGIADAIQTAAAAQAALLSERIPGQRELAKPAITAPSDREEQNVDAPQVVTIDIDLRFRDLKAAVPLFSKDLSYASNALIRPIVAFINANKTLVPIHCRIVKNIEDFDGCWTMWETGLMDDIAIKTYDALAYHVTQANFNRRVKTVSWWSLQRTASAAAAALQSVVHPMVSLMQELDMNDFSLKIPSTG